MTISAVGLMSVTFRHADPALVVDVAASTGCELVSWSGDVHVPEGDAAAAARARHLTREHGLAVECYGSYWRADGPFDAWLRTALDLGATRIRIWAGAQGSVGADPAGRDVRDQVEARIADAADLAAAHGVTLVLEYHRNTLTDTLASTLDLLSAIDDRRASGALPVLSYWQPRHGIDATEAEHEVRTLAPRLAGLHVFSWTASGERRPLAEGEPLWRSVVEAVRSLAQAVPLMLEFVRDDDRLGCVADVATLRDWVGGVDGNPPG